MNITTEQERAKVLLKARKVLGLTVSPNEHEAARAMEMLHTILAKHNLSMAEVTGEIGILIEDDSWCIPTSKWRQGICNGTAMLYFSGYLVRSGRISGGDKTVYDQHVFIGEEHNVAVAQMMAQYMIAAVERLSKEAADRYADVMSLANTSKRYEAYKSGFEMSAATRLFARMMQRIAAARAGSAMDAEEKTNLPALLDEYTKAQAAVIDYNRKKGRALVPQDGMEARNRQGVIDGRKAADGIGLDTQVNAATATQIG